GIFLSKPIDVNGNVKTMSLETDEEIPYGGKDIMPFTDIEYYITNMETPTVDDWYPIAPAKRKQIYAELLSFAFDAGKYKATLRFNPEAYQMIRVRKDGVEIFEVIGDFVVTGNEITIRNFDPSAVYTCQYVPDRDAYTI